MEISVTKFRGLHLMKVQLHGLGSWMFQFENGGDEVFSHVNNVEASWLAAVQEERRVEK